MKLKYDPEANAAYIRFCEKAVARSRHAPHNKRNVGIDYAKDGSVIGIEILGIRRGIDLTGVPEAEQVEELLRREGFSILEPVSKPKKSRRPEANSPAGEAISVPVDTAAMKLTYDPEANAAYIRFCDKEWSRMRHAPRNRGNVLIDYAKDGTILGVEILGMRQGIDLTGVPEAEQVGELLKANGFAAYARKEWPADWRQRKGRSPLQKSTSGGKNGDRQM